MGERVLGGGDLIGDGGRGRCLLQERIHGVVRDEQGQVQERGQGSSGARGQVHVPVSGAQPAARVRLGGSQEGPSQVRARRYPARSPARACDQRRNEWSNGRRARLAGPNNE